MSLNELKENPVSCDVIIPVINLNSDILHKSLCYLMYLKGKRTSKVKASACVDSWSQRKYITNKEISATIIPTNALILVCLIAATQQRQVTYSWHVL